MEKPVAESDPHYRIKTTRYDRKEKIMIKVGIMGTDGNEHNTTVKILPH